MRTDGDLLILRPALPAQWRSYRFRLRYQGALLEVRVNDRDVELQVLDGGPVRVCVYGVEVDVDAGGITVRQEQPRDLDRDASGQGSTHH